MGKIIIYADGACSGNQFEENVGGWGAVLQYNGKQKELYGGTKMTTNNKMELTAAIKALEELKVYDIPIEVYLDSAYVISGITVWIYGWIKKGWVTSKKKPVENRELWERLYNLKRRFDSIEFIKVKGHSGNEGNDRADELANKGMNQYK